ncbi:DUF4236 domain-containing protein [Cellulomonas sp. P5_C6]
MLIRKSFGLGPFRLTLSRRGLGASLGGRGWRVQSSKGGSNMTLRVPGTGLSYRRRLGK